MPPGLDRWVVGGFVAVLATMVVALGVALVSPPAGLLVLALSSLPERLVARRAPHGYHDWA